MEWKIIATLICGSNVDYYKHVHQPVPARENREHLNNFQNVSVSYQYLSLIVSVDHKDIFLRRISRFPFSWRITLNLIFLDCRCFPFFRTPKLVHMFPLQFSRNNLRYYIFKLTNFRKRLEIFEKIFKVNI